MKPGTLVPIRGKFESAKALLYHIAEDAEMAEFVIVTIRKDGTIARAQFEMTRANMAYASVVIAGWSREED